MQNMQQLHPMLGAEDTAVTKEEVLPLMLDVRGKGTTLFKYCPAF